MKLTVACQTCGKVLVCVENTGFSQDDLSMYEENCFCDTQQGIDDNGNPIYDGTNNIQAVMTVN